MALEPTSFSPEEYFQHRKTQLEQRELVLNEKTYPHKFHTTTNVELFRKNYNLLTPGQHLESVTVSIAGRVTSVRTSGAKLVFYDVRQDGHDIQVWFNGQYYSGSEEEIADIRSTITRGDIIGISGFPARTKRGELSLIPRRIQLLSPCLVVLPGAKNKLTDKETRYRNRHIDLIVNHEAVRAIFAMRSSMIREIRSYFDERGFMEVETPMFNPIPGGAAARPFKTYMNSLGIEIYMRISPELYLKKLVVGGMEKVYEIGRQMRNEGLDLTHNPEFTSIETYEGYNDVYDLYVQTEELLYRLALKLKGVAKFDVQSFSGDKDEVKEIDFTPPYRKVSMISELEKILGVKFPRPLNSDTCNEFLVNICEDRGIKLTPPTTTARVLDTLVGEFIEPTCINPTFICDHPQLMSPLAKYHRDDEELTERFELFINGKEICNAYTELNDPHVQRKCFADQAKDREAGDDEAQIVDHSFINALDHGLPPTAGWGMGIDRLVMMFTGQKNIKEVLLFPMMRPLEEESGNSEASSSSH